MSIPEIRRQEITQRTNRRNRDVEAHEDAHERAAGPYATGKTINFGTDRLGNPFATGGHVRIIMPPKVTFKSSMSQIQQAEEHAKTVAAAAIAPLTLGGEAGRLSAADKAVYAQANAAFSKANDAKSRKLSLRA